MGGFLLDLEGELLSELRRRSTNRLYATDPDAWLWDVLGKRWWSKQQEIAQSFASNAKTLVKSCNGVGKSQIAGDLTCWFVSIHRPEETSVAISAPVRAQINEVLFKYLRENYGVAEERGHKLVGEITNMPVWKVEPPDAPFDKRIVVPRRPSDQNLLSAFQGIHDPHVAVILDEAGGLQADFFTGADAVTTNEDAHILGVGNPDRRDTAFHDRFRDREKFADWNTITIGAKDSPNFTGELIYPDDPERDAFVKSKLVQVKWAEMMRRSSLPGIVAAKVDGEFPSENADTFFSQVAINTASTADLSDRLTKPVHRWLGVDIAYTGEDKCVAYLNVGGYIRKVDEWDRSQGTEHMQSAQRIHDLAKLYEVGEVRIDAAGTGAGVYSNLHTEEKFADGQYLLIGVLGANASPNLNVWRNARAWHYDTFRKGMVEGRIDLDITGDTELKTDLEAQSYAITGRSQIQITSKAEMKRHGIHSPDHLDAAIYAAIETGASEELADVEDGDLALADPWEMAEMDLAGLPV